MLRILIVEDEWLIAEDHAAQLRNAGHHIVGPVPSVAAAIDCITSQKPDLALLDVQLNDETSYAVADTLLEKAIPFAFTTGYGHSEIPPRFAGIRVLQKPVDGAELIAAVIVVADKHAAAKVG